MKIFPLFKKKTSSVSDGDSGQVDSPVADMQRVSIEESLKLEENGAAIEEDRKIVIPEKECCEQKISLRDMGKGLWPTMSPLMSRRVRL